MVGFSYKCHVSYQIFVTCSKFQQFTFFFNEIIIFSLSMRGNARIFKNRKRKNKNKGDKNKCREMSELIDTFLYSYAY